MTQGIVGRGDTQVTQTSFRIRERTAQQAKQVLFGQGAQFKDLGARNQRGIDEEKWVVRGGADESHGTGLDVRQEHILLGFVEPMNFVDEEDRWLTCIGEPVGGAMPEPGGWNRIQVEVDSLDAALARLAAAGIEARGDVIDGIGGRQALVEDASANPIELFEPGPGEARQPSERTSTVRMANWTFRTSVSGARSAQDR